MLRSRNKERKNGERLAPASEEELRLATTSASRLWREIRSHGNDAMDQKSGLTAWFDHDNDRAFVRHRRGPVQWATTAIGYDGNANWEVVSTHYGPGTELEPHGAIVARSTTYPLTPGENTYSSTAVYRQRRRGDMDLDLIEVGTASIGEPVSSARAQAIAEECSQLADVAGIRRTLGQMAAVVETEVQG